MESARDARRRKILERGTDRLAFITGQVRSLPPSAAPSEQHDPQPTVASLGKDEPTNLELPSHDAGKQTISGMVESDNKVELSAKCETSPEFPSCEVSNGSLTHEISNGSGGSAHGSVKSEEPPTAPMAPRPSESVVDINPRKSQYRWTFTPQKINNCISATKNIRLLSTIMIALLVVLSCHGYSLGGNLLRGVINFRPLFLVLATDLSIVLGRLLVTQGSDVVEEEASRQGWEDGWADSVSRALELGLVLQKFLGAAFMDCSICAVIMICGVVA